MTHGKVDGIGENDHKSNSVDKWEQYKKMLENSAGGGYMASTQSANHPNSIFVS